MITTLTVLIFIIFVGLGVPDSALGAAWPSIYVDLNLPIGSQSLISFLVSVGTISASFFSARLINKFGTGKVTCFSTLLTAIALLGFHFSNSLVLLLVSAIPLGAGAGAIDSALNNFAATHFSSFSMNLMHCFYGFGVACSPFIFSLTIKYGGTYNTAYLIIFFIQLFITIMSFVALPLWKKAKANEQKTQAEFIPITLSFKEMAKIKAIVCAWALFFFSCALEFACDNWISTYLRDTFSISESTANIFTTVYFLGIMSGRFISGLLTKKLRISTITQAGLTLIFIAVLVQFLPLPFYIKGASFFLLGFGNGPIFPNMTFITPKRFGKERSQSIISSQMVACNIGVMLSPMICGGLAELFGIEIFPIYIAVLFLALTISIFVYNKNLKKLCSEGI